MNEKDQEHYEVFKEEMKMIMKKHFTGNETLEELKTKQAAFNHDYNHAAQKCFHAIFETDNFSVNYHMQFHENNIE
jgi:hypothetical protein